jgi:hypothetical protein
LNGVTVEKGSVQAKLSDTLQLTFTLEGAAPLVFDKSDIEIQMEQTKALRDMGIWYQCEGKIERAPLADGGERWQMVFLLDPFKNAEVMLPFVPLDFTEGPEKKARHVEWQPIPLAITTEIEQPDLAEMRDIPLPEQLPPVPSERQAWWIGLGGFAGVVLALAGWVLQRRRKVPEPALLPHQGAMKELERIEALDLSASGQAERLHTLLSDVLRRYFEQRYQLPASLQTTAEFLRAIRSRPELSGPQQAALREFLERCDLAKVAPICVPPEECRATTGLARRLIEQASAVPSIASIC